MGWIGNAEMRALLKAVAASKESLALHTDVTRLRQLFLPPIKRVGDCIIIASESVEEIEPYLDEAVQMYGDKTGYEASNSEVMINDFFDQPLSRVQGTRIALLAADLWAMQLKTFAPETTFRIILSSDDESVIIRFHQVRADELGWLSEDVESYKYEAVGYMDTE